MGYPVIISADQSRNDQLKQLALIAHHCYGSFDLALRCVMLLEQRQALQAGTQRRYLEILGNRRVTNQIRWD